MKFSFFSLFVCVVLLVGLGACFAGGYVHPHRVPHQKEQPKASLQIPEKETESTTTFQPDAQILERAIQPGRSLARPGAVRATSSRDTHVPLEPQGMRCTTTAGNSEHFACLESYYRSVVDTSGIDVAFSDLKSRYTRDPFVASFCHPLTHVIGRRAANLYTQVGEAYQHGDSFCWSGYYHGVLEGIVKNIGAENLASKLNTICSALSGKASHTFDYYNCVHGLGHGIMELGADDVFTSLTSCDSLSGAWERESCYSGVFMENIITFDREGSTKDLRPSEPLYPCTAVGKAYKYQCFLGQTSFVLAQNGGDFKKTFDACALVEETYRDVCGQSVGRDAANYARHDAPQTKITCELAPDARAIRNCVIGAVKEFISYYHSRTEADAYCSMLRESEKDTCLSTGEKYFKLF